MPIALDSRLRGPVGIVSPDDKYLFLGTISWVSAGFVEELRPKER